MKKRIPNLTSSSLHWIAMLSMLMDHIRLTIFPQAEILNCLGRIAFPLFAFLLVEGFFYTDNRRAYLKRLIFLAMISELPYDWMISGIPFSWKQQNVVWTLTVGFLAMGFLEEKKKTVSRPMWYLLTAMGVCWILAALLRFDYGFPGILLILTFYFCRGYSKISHIMLTVLFILIQVFLMGGMQLSGGVLHIYGQIFALLALIPIRAYCSRKGKHYYRTTFYLFYPIHMIALCLARQILSSS